jgi:hypothetical protein
MYESYSPSNYNESKDMLKHVVGHHPRLKTNFPGGVWAATTVNLGPRTVTYKHRDRLNKLTGWCCITALGDNFDDERGGHLILWDLDLVIRFPAGASIMIPSALLYHSNISIAWNETRYSLTQYTSGNLFRWVANGFRSEADFEGTATVEEKSHREAVEVQRKQDNLRCFLPYEKLGEC